MNSNSDLNNTSDFSENSEASDTLSIEDFFKQLEAKEKDLDISSEMVIEIEESDFHEPKIPAFKPVETTPAALPPIVSSLDPPILPVFPAAAVPTKQPEIYDSAAEMANLREQVSRMESERLEYQETARRRQSEFENYKSRTERERGETFRNQLGNLTVQMLPVLDNMNRALDATHRIAAEKTTEFQRFVEGIELVSQQLNEILAEMGVQPITAVGETFDPHLHEAVATEINDELPTNTITAELLRGYRIGDRTIRPSMVKVSAGSQSGRLPELPTVLRNAHTSE